MPHEIVVKIGKTGKTEISVNGAKGDSCREITKQLIGKLGDVDHEEPTTEMYESESENAYDTHSA